MKALTASQMREVDRRSIELGIPGLILMENAGHRVAEFLIEKFAPLGEHHVVILCGKGNNGGDGLVLARQLWLRARPTRLDVVLAADPAQLRGDAAENFRMLRVCGCPVASALTPEMREATIVVDALLGTGLNGPAFGDMTGLIREINAGFPRAKIVAVDIPSGLGSDSGAIPGEAVQADYTVTFTAPKVGHVLPPACDRVGELRVCAIGSPPSLYEGDESIFLSLLEPAVFRHLLGPRPRGSNKGDFGHVLVIAGSRGKTGAAAMTGLAALRTGAGLVTVASAQSAIPVIASHAPELMTEPLPETENGAISLAAFDHDLLAGLIKGKDVIAMGPGLGTHPETVSAVRRLVEEAPQYLVIDADGLNALAGVELKGRNLILTPHPGEMARLTGKRTAEVQADRVGIARGFSTEHGVTLVLKGQRTLIAFPDGRVWVNPTGTPGMATGGSGDILTGMLAGLLAQAPQEVEAAIAAAVYLHGLAGEYGAEALGERTLIATDLLAFLPEAMDECAGIPDTL
ncbi:MAG: NAD(P)H-hydrate dehydratase [Acidobacteria bacterium]|nr:NAD(P)H-hydrate dehydratase [Acidobacteriota bacterium]